MKTFSQVVQQVMRIERFFVDGGSSHIVGFRVGPYFFGGPDEAEATGGIIAKPGMLVRIETDDTVMTAAAHGTIVVDVVRDGKVTGSRFESAILPLVSDARAAQWSELN